MTAFLYSLRMAGDLLLYSAFAAFFAAALGGHPAPWILLLPAVCYGVSSCVFQHRLLRTVCGAVSLAGLLLVPGWADRAAYLPAALYTVYLTVQGEYSLSADRQMDLFLLFCKVYPIFAAALGVVWDGQVMLTVSLPLAIWTVLLQIFLVRVLRQPPAVYRDPLYLLGNAGLLGILGLLGFLVSRPAVLGAAQAGAGALYFNLVVPVLTIPLNLLAWLAEHLLLPAILALLRWIAAGSGNPDPEILTHLAEGSSSGRDLSSAGEPLINGTLVVYALGAVLLAAGCVLLFRRMLRKSGGTASEAAPAAARQSVRKARRRWPGFFLSPNARVRRAYGRYLERQAQHGVTRAPSETSLDLLGRTPFLDPDAEQQLRRLYLKARYGECATSQDAAAAERLEKALEQSEQDARR